MEVSTFKIAVIITITSLTKTKVVHKKIKLKTTAMRQAVKVEALSHLEAHMELSVRYENYHKKRNKRS